MGLLSVRAHDICVVAGLSSAGGMPTALWCHLQTSNNPISVVQKPKPGKGETTDLAGNHLIERDRVEQVNSRFARNNKNKLQDT